MRYIYMLLIVALLAGCTAKVETGEEETINESVNETIQIVQEDTGERLPYPTAIFLTKEQIQLREVKSFVNFSLFLTSECENTIKFYQNEIDSAVAEEDDLKDDLEAAQEKYDTAQTDLRQAESTGDERAKERAQIDFERANDVLDDAEDKLDDWQKYRDAVVYTWQQVELECKMRAALK